jgi:ABC-2 type transport system permease protein
MRPLRVLDMYAAFGAVAVKQMLQFRIYFWMGLITQTIFMVAWFSFWHAAYASRHTIGGLHEEQAIRYILLARILAPANGYGLTSAMGNYLRQGLITAELLRPLDFQARFYAQSAARALAALLQLSLFSTAVAMIFLGLRLPTDPAIWAGFALTFILGNAILFFFDYLIACLAFYTTEIWGLSVLQAGITTFTSGALVPLTMMPGWLHSFCAAIPFSQTLFVPVSILSGITPASQVPTLALQQCAWIVSLCLVSRLAFRHAVRTITVQGG